MTSVHVFNVGEEGILVSKDKTGVPVIERLDFKRIILSQSSGGLTKNGRREVLDWQLFILDTYIS
jgi:hypothetical protein